MGGEILVRPTTESFGLARSCIDALIQWLRDSPVDASDPEVGVEEPHVVLVLNWFEELKQRVGN
jgi:hypothetical protein